MAEATSRYVRNQGALLRIQFVAVRASCNMTNNTLTVGTTPLQVVILQYEGVALPVSWTKAGNVITLVNAPVTDTIVHGWVVLDEGTTDNEG